MPDVLVSFVVPAYNEEALIASCLASIQAEIARIGCPAEIIVVDNMVRGRPENLASLPVAGLSRISMPIRSYRRAGCALH